MLKCDKSCKQEENEDGPDKCQCIHAMRLH